MPMVQLSAHFVSTATSKPQAKKVDYYDKTITGFILEVRPTGGATYYLRYRDSHGRQRQYKIGDHKSLSFEKAKHAAKVLRSKVVLGDSPIEERQIKKSVPTFEEFVRDTYLPHITVTRRNTSSDRSHLKLHLLPKIGSLPLSQISQQHVLECHDDLLAKGYAKATANRSMVLIKIVFNLAKKMQTPGADTNPANGIKFADPQNARERFLTKEETQRLLQAIEQSENLQLKFVIPLLLLTGARKREILDAKWDEINLEKRFLRVPLSKSGKPRFIPLSQSVLSILESLPRWDDCPYVIPNPKTKKPFSSLYVSWNGARRRAGLPDVRMHDLRHSYASNLVNAGTSIFVVSRALGHATLKNTMRYSHLSQETLLDAAEKASLALGV
jgi:integrase